TVKELAAGLEQARQTARDRRDDWRRAQHAITAAQAEVDRAQKAASELISRRSALEEARVRLASSLAEAEAARAEAETGIGAAGDEAAAGAQAAAAQAASRAAREQLDQAR